MEKVFSFFYVSLLCPGFGSPTLTLRAVVENACSLCLSQTELIVNHSIQRSLLIKFIYLPWTKSVFLLNSSGFEERDKSGLGFNERWPKISENSFKI